MKKLMSVLIVFTMIIGMTIPALAATPEKYSDCTTNAERSQYLKDTYGITEIYEIETVKDGKWTTDPVGTQRALNTVQSGLSLIGSSTVKKIFAQYDKLTLDIRSKESSPGRGAAFGTGGDFMFKENAPTHSVVHEAMHAFDYGLLKKSGATTVGNINGNYSNYTNANQYATQYAATDSAEDFAETCAAMIVNGGDTPTTVGKDTILYKKYKACYDLMVEHFGEKSNAVKRSAAFLGLTVQ